MPRSDAELEAGRLTAGEITHPGDEQHELARCGEHAMPGGTHTRLSLRDRARRGDLSRHLRPWQHTPDAGLRALAQLQLDTLHRIVGGLVGELLRVEVPVLGARAEVGGAELQITSAPCR